MKNIPITNIVVMSLDLFFFFFGHIAAGLFLLQETLLQLNVMEHMCPLSGVASSTVGL